MNFFFNLFGFRRKENNNNNSDLKNLDMKYLIAGLGNIGVDYDNTRHNIGFEVVDALAKQFDCTFKNDTQANVAQFKHKGRTFILIKPTTYMNLSGKAIRYWLQKEKITQENLLVVLDDLNLVFNKLRLKPNGSDGGHNGLKNINLLLGNNNYARLRIGIGNKFEQGRQVDYVLGKWSKEESNEMPNILERAKDAVLGFGTIGIEMTMNQCNK